MTTKPQKIEKPSWLKYTEKEVKAKRESTIKEQKKLFSFSASPSASKPISRP